MPSTLPQPQILIRPAGPGDAAAILAMEALFPGDRMSARSVRHFLRAPSARLWVAERAGAVIGNLVLLMPQRWRVARIYSVVVAPQARGLGAGAQLVQAAEAEAARQQREAMVLEVRADNAAARALYARQGYRVDTALQGYYEDGADGLRLRKQL